jgi:phosphoribosyl 1,2-cyclic phosphate phosphodiesterase
VQTRGGTHLLIDTPPELRLQLVAAGIDRADAVLYTHEHADHIHGIDDLRALSVRIGRALPLYGSRETLDTLRARFPTSSIRPCAPAGHHQARGALHEISDGTAFTIGDA